MVHSIREPYTLCQSTGYFIQRQADIAYDKVIEAMRKYAERCVDAGIVEEGEAKIYLEEGPFALIIESMDKDMLTCDRKLHQLKRTIGQWGGLSPETHHYRQRIVVNVEGFGGHYTANHLETNPHYGVRCTPTRLKQYLLDAARMKLPFSVVEADNGDYWDGEICAMPETQDVVIITPGNSAIIANKTLEEIEKMRVIGVDDFVFMNICDCSMDDALYKTFRELQHEDVYRYLANDSYFDIANGSRERNQAKALNFQFSSLNATDASHEMKKKIGKCAPKITTKYNKQKQGWRAGSKSLVEDISENMAGLTSVGDCMASYFKVEAPFLNVHSVRNFAASIHPNNRGTGYTATLTEVDDNSELSAHVDTMNASNPQSCQVVGSYRYFVREGSSGESKLSRVYQALRCQDICEKQCMEEQEIERLYSEMVELWDEMDECQKTNPPKISDCTFRRHGPWEYPDAAYVGVSIYRTVFCSLFASRITKWVQQRHEMGTPVHEDEIIEALCSITRGSVPGSWAFTFDALTSKSGYTLSKNGLTVGDRKMSKKQKCEKPVLDINDSDLTPRDDSRDCCLRFKEWERSKTFLEQFDELHVTIHGGMECGMHPRCQPCHGQPQMSKNKYYVDTPRSLKNHIDQLNAKTDSLRHANGDGKLDQAAIRDLASSFITNVSKPVGKGGMMGVGEFWANILLQTASILGLVPGEYVTCSFFSRDSGTASFIAQQFNLSVRNDRLLQILASKPLFKRYGIWAYVIAENMCCELKRNRYGKVLDRCGSRYTELVFLDRYSFFAKGLRDGSVTVAFHRSDQDEVIKLRVDDAEALNCADSKVGEDAPDHGVIELRIAKGQLPRRIGMNWWGPNYSSSGVMDVDSTRVTNQIYNYTMYLKSDHNFDFSKTERIAAHDRNKFRSWARTNNKKNAPLLRKPPPDNRVCQSWAVSKCAPKKKGFDRHRTRHHLKELVHAVEMKKLEGCDIYGFNASDFVGKSMSSIARLIVDAISSGNLLIDGSVEEMLRECLLDMESDEKGEMDSDNDEDIKVKGVPPHDIDDVLRNIRHCEKRRDKDYRPPQRLSSRTSVPARGFRYPAYSVVKSLGVEKPELRVRLDINATVKMVDLDVHPTFVCTFKSISLESGRSLCIHYAKLIQKNGKVLASSSDEECPNKAEDKWRKRLSGSNKGPFTVGAVPGHPGAYFTCELAKLSALVSYVLKSNNGSSDLWDRLLPNRCLLLVSPKLDDWDKSISVNGGHNMTPNPMILVLRHPQGISFVDMIQLNWIECNRDDGTTRSTRKNPYIEIDSTEMYPDISSLLRDKKEEHVSSIVGYCTTTKDPTIGISGGRNTEYIHHEGTEGIPDGTLEVRVRRLKSSKRNGEPQYDSLFYLPKTNAQLRSKNECKMLVKYLLQYEGDEHLALAAFWRSRDNESTS